MSNSFEVIKVNGILNWAFFTRKNDMSDRYSVDVCNLSEADVAKLEASGLSVRTEPKDDQDRGRFITVKSKERYFRVEDANGVEMSEETQGKVGNGTKAGVAINVIPYSGKYGTGVMAGMKTVHIFELVEYSDGGDENFGTWDNPADAVVHATSSNVDWANGDEAPV